jgi:phage terminase large subunit-like protein
MTIDAVTERWILNRSDELAVEQGCRFDQKHADKPCEFMEKFCHLSQGRWAGQKLALIGWQRTFTQRLFGWRQRDGRRRFRRAFLMAAKKQGKSPLMSGLALYLLLMDGEQAPECYLCAVDRDQAGLIYTEAERMTQFSPALGKRVEVIPSRKIITSGHGKIVANSADSPKLDGLNASAVIFDELHRQQNRLLWDVMAYATAARTQPLTISVTTAGESEGDDEIWYEQRRYSKQVEAGVIQDTTHLGVIYAASEDDDIDDPATWRKANPSLGVTFTEDDFRRDLEEAKTSPAKLQNFKRLRLNIVCQSEEHFINLPDWDECSEWNQPEADTPLFLGLDLSSRDDLTALVGIAGSFASGFDVLCQFWLPKEGIEELEKRHGQPYRQWATEGLIKLTDGNTVDYEAVEADIVQYASSRNLIKLKADPYNGKKLCENLLNKHGLPVEYIRQGYLSLSDPTKTLLELVISRKLRHGGHRILRWHVSNAIARTDPAGNVKLDKSKRRLKIDGVAALVNAIAGAIEAGDSVEPSVYESRGPIMLDASGNMTHGSHGSLFINGMPIHRRVY